MAKRGETIVLQASRRYKLWLASFCLLCLLLMGIFYLSPKGGPISMILFWLLFVGVLGLVNCTRSGDIVLTAKYLESGIFYRRRFPWDKITEVWTGDEHIWWSGTTVNAKKERTCKNQFDHWGRQCKSNRKQVSKDLAVEWIEKIRSVGSEEERKQLIRKLRTNRPPRILRTRSQLSPEDQEKFDRLNSEFQTIRGEGTLERRIEITNYFKQKGWQLDPIKVSEGQKIFGCLFLLFILVAGVVILSIFYRHLFP